MKQNFILTMLYIVQLVFFYLLISAMGLIWFKWHDIIHSEGWNMIYWVFVGWWIPLPVCIAYHEQYIETNFNY